MTPRIARVVIPGFPHHVTQRGSHRQSVFFAASDRELYLELLRTYFIQYRVDMEGYTLMSNYTYEVLIPLLTNSLGDFERIRLATRTGRPLGNEEFVQLSRLWRVSPKSLNAFG
jgi:putative transposase